MRKKRKTIKEIGLLVSSIRLRISMQEPLRHIVNDLVSKDSTLSRRSLIRWYYDNTDAQKRLNLQQRKYHEFYNWEDYADNIMWWYNVQDNPDPETPIMTPRNIYVEGYEDEI